MMTKQEIREEIKKRISSLNADSLKAQSDTICQIILSSKLYKASTAILGFMPLSDEVDITPVIQTALSQKKKIFLPRIISGTKHMEFYSIDSDTQTQSGSFGISEPPAEDSKSFSRFLEKMAINEYSPAAHSSDYVEIESHESPREHILVLVPGRAFTKDGKRLGRGKGFYDIYLSQLPQIFDIKKSGVCFSQQILPDLPTTPDDIMMDFLFSSKS